MITQLQRLSLSMVGMAMLTVPITGFAYLSPQQVFGDGSSAFSPTDPGTHQAPPLQREGDQFVENQQKKSAELRDEAQKDLVPTYAEPVDTYVPEKTQESKGLFDENAQYEKRQERIENAKGDGPTIIVAGDGTVVDSNGNVLHSGAPKVTATGPESILAAIAMILAAVCTFAYARVKAHAVTLSSLA